MSVHNQERTRTLLVALSLACLEIRFVVEGAGAVMLRFCLEYKRVLERFSLDCRKTKTKVNTLANQRA